MIAGYTDYDDNYAALAAIMAEWTRSDIAFADRVDHLRGAVSGGYNGTFVLNATTVHDDVTADNLTGSSGLTGSSSTKTAGSRTGPPT